MKISETFSATAVIAVKLPKFWKTDTCGFHKQKFNLYCPLLCEDETKLSEEQTTALMKV